MKISEYENDFKLKVFRRTTFLNGLLILAILPFRHFAVKMELGLWIVAITTALISFASSWMAAKQFNIKKIAAFHTLSIGFALWLISYNNGGFHAPALYVYIALPIIGGYFAGWKFSSFLTFLIFLGMGLLLYFHETGMLPHSLLKESENYLYAKFVVLTLVVIAFGGLSYFYDIRVNSLIQQLSAIFNHCPNPQFIAGKKGQIIFSNAEAKSLEKSSSSFMEYFRSDMSKKWKELKAKGNTLYNLSHEGSLFEVKFIRLDLKSSDFYLFQLNDITHQASLENSKDEFVSIVSHELKTPLTAISGSLLILQDDSIPKDQKTVDELVRMLSPNVQRMTKLVNDIVDAEALKKGKVHFQPALHSFSKILDSAIFSVESIAKLKDVELEVIDRNIMKPYFVHADRERLIQVMVNLLSNSIKFSPSSSKVVIRSELKKETLFIYFRDEGEGITEDLRRKLFESFTKGSNINSSVQPGIGLGLFMARQLMELHGGSLGLASSDSDGSEFYMELPLIIPKTPSSN